MIKKLQNIIANLATILDKKHSIKKRSTMGYGVIINFSISKPFHDAN